jgi:fatty-acid peroxygenase
MTDLAVLFHRCGYDAIDIDRRDRGGGPTYPSRLMGRRAVVLGGARGARQFYDESLVERHGSVPAPLAWLLFGRGAVHGLDDEPHRDRKLMFLDALSVERLGPLFAEVRSRLEEARDGWSGREVSLFDELVRVYGGAVLAWAGVEDGPARGIRLSRQLAAIVDGFGFAGRAYPRAWRARRRVSRWATGLIRDARAGRVPCPDDSPLAEIARQDLDPRTAGVELVNILRPTVAVAWLGTFAGSELQQLPDWRHRLSGADSDAEAYAFVEEVRRTTPFVPALAGRAREQRRIDGVDIRRGDRLVLDVIGINHDPRSWADPHSFRPERFLFHEPGAFELVPQGGGHPSGHRCPGEPIALGVLIETVRVLAATEYDVVSPREPDRSRIPTLPPGGLVLGRVRVPAARH